MKKILMLGFVILFGLSACVPGLLNDDAAAPPAVPVDVSATVEAGASTQAVQTVEALATPTMEATATIEPSPTNTATETVTETLTSTETPEGTAEETTGTPGTPEGSDTPESEDTTATATLEANADTPTPTATLAATAASIHPSPTSPIVANDAPDYIPRYKIKVRNNTKVRVYLSLQGSTAGDYHPIIEYDLAPFQKVKLTVPEGYYAVIVYVGNDPMVGYVGVHSSNTVEIKIEKEQIKISK